MLQFLIVCPMIRITLEACVASLVGSHIGSRLSLLVSEAMLENLMLVILPIVAFYVLRNKNLGAGADREALPEKTAFVIAVLAAFVIGGYDGFYGPGTATFLISGNVCFALGLAAGVFCIAGHYIGSGLVVHNGQKIVRPVILVVLAVLFVKIITEA